MSWLTAALGVDASKQAGKTAAWQQKLAQPLYEAQTRALPMLWDQIMRQYTGPAEKESAFLKTQHGLNLGGIEKERAKSTSASNWLWKAMGNTGRGRGEALRIGQGAQEATNRENLAYGQAQEGLQRTGQDRLFNALMASAGMGAGGLQGMFTSAQTKLAGTQEYGEDMGTLFGKLGEYGARVYQKWRKKSATTSEA